MLAYLDTLIGFAVVMLGSSLLITIATQMVSTLFSHRGANLKWGIDKMLGKLGIVNPANENIAHDVLTHPLISDSIFSKWRGTFNRMTLATAISPDELVVILKDLAANKYTAAAFPAINTAITNVLNERNAAVDRQIEKLTGAPNLPAALAVAGAAPVIEHTVASIKDSAGKLEAWFGATMDRVSQRFTTYMRIWTIAFGCVLAFGTGLNSVTLLNKIYTNGAFRQQLVGAAPQVSDLAAKVLPDGPKDVVTKMFNDLMTKALQDSQVKPSDGATPSGIDSQAAGAQWIQTHVSAADQPKVQAAFDKAFLDQRVQDAAALRTIATKSSFDISQFGWTGGQPSWPQVPGVLATWALLTLGAPFWFNALKQLTNLRPILAQKQDTPDK